MTDERSDLEAFFGPVVSQYTTEQAVDDGVLIPAGHVGRHKVHFTRALWEDGYEDQRKRIDLVTKGLLLLQQPEEEDTPYMRLRVIEHDEIWAIAEPDKITYMKPSDY